MKNKNDLFLKTIQFTLGLMLVFSFNPQTAFSQKKCSKKGKEKTFTFQNSMVNPIHIKSVDDDCREGAGKLLGPGQKIGGSSFTGVVFRVYDLSDNLISEIVLEESKTEYIIEAEENDSTENGVKIDPAEGFLKATNEIRAAKNLAPMQLDKRLNDACQFLADQMAEVDKGYPVHTLSELGRKKEFQKRNKASQRLVYYGWEKRNTVHFEATGLDTVRDYNQLGSKFAKGWTGTNTHDKPFFDKHKYKYNRVGFGVAKAKRGTNRYYACAIFGKQK
jgi:uncharacterized protein YkwD